MDEVFPKGSVVVADVSGIPHLCTLVDDDEIPWHCIPLDRYPVELSLSSLGAAGILRHGSGTCWRDRKALTVKMVLRPTCFSLREGTYEIAPGARAVYRYDDGGREEVLSSVGGGRLVVERCVPPPKEPSGIGAVVRCPATTKLYIKMDSEHYYSEACQWLTWSGVLEETRGSVEVMSAGWGPEDEGPEDDF